MTHAFLAAATTLQALLAQENAALQAMDLPAATALLPGKRAAAEHFAAAHARLAAAQDRTLPRAEAQEAAIRVQDLARTNRRLLTRALAVQEQVIGVLVGALPRAEPGRYGARGRIVANRAIPPLALSANA